MMKLNYLHYLIGLLCFAGIHIASYAAENQLKNHPAPYLALHGDDPIAWQDWSPEVLALAREENKVVLLSVGYFACHWCHVMQRESFQNEEVAAFMNQNFVAVKIDRELEPALDQYLMEFAQATTGNGGWPLNVFVTPEGSPIFAMLYAPTDVFMDVLKRMQQVWGADADRVRRLVATEAAAPLPELNDQIDIEIIPELLNAATESILSRADQFQGGFGSQSKFPSTPQLRFLLNRYEDTGNELVRDFLVTTLDAMANNGLRDHLQGGFFRYSVDPGWEIPHFEKMLYDNASIARLFIEAGSIFEKSEYHDVARDTLDFMQQKMWLEGAMVASFSAVDTENVEGGHYLWQPDELEQLLDARELKLIDDLWGMAGPAELEAGNHIRWVRFVDDYAAANSLSAESISKALAAIKQKLNTRRLERELPVDDKLIASWNALALSTFVRASEIYQHKPYLDTAQRLRNFLVDHILIQDTHELVRAIAKGRPQGTTSIEDYAMVSEALWEWGALTNSDADRKLAQSVADLGWAKYFRENGWHSSAEGSLAGSGPREITEDRVIPSASATLINVSLATSRHFNDEVQLRRIRGAVNRSFGAMKNSPFWYVSHLLALERVALDSLK